MLKFWLIIIYKKDASAMDGEYPAVYNEGEQIVWTDQKAAQKCFADIRNIPTGERVELVECISNKTIDVIEGRKVMGK